MQLLSTKLSIPPLRSRLVVRSRLIQKLNQGMECGFVLVSAPAGYGKSTLLSAWLSQLEYATTWLSLDDGDNDPLRFLTYLEAALGKIEPSLGNILESSLRSSPLPEIEALLTPLVNALAGVERPFCLVLDDYHVIKNQLVHQAVSLLLEHRPAPLHLVIATRADPPLPLARLRARASMVELRLADLRFTSQEAADFLDQTMGLKITTEDVVRITDRTEGWIAGLQIAALSLQNAEDVPGFITSFTGSHHYIFDYLMEEILGRQSPEVRRFLLYTSILDQMTAPLCDALFEGDGESTLPRPSATILDEVEHANLFIVPLDPEHRWYRFHPLFAELLQSYLQKNTPGEASVLHARASAWFEGQGLAAEAISHALAAGEWERVLRLISANVFALLEQNELSSVARQLDSLTAEKSLARPWLWIGRAWLAAYTGQLSSVEHFLNLVEDEINKTDGQVMASTLRGYIAAVRAYAAWIGYKRDVAVQAAREALEHLPPTDFLMRCQAATVLGLSLYNFSERTQAYEQALVYAREIRISHVTIFAQLCWAFFLAMGGRLHEAYALCQEAVRQAQSGGTHQPMPALSHVYTTMSLVLFEWNDLEGALRYARQAVELARRWEQADALHFAYTHLGNALFASGDVEGAFEVLNQEWQVAQRTSPWFEAITLAQEVEWHLAQDNLDAALYRSRLNQVNIEGLSTGIPKIRLAIARMEYDEALRLVDQVLEDLEIMGAGYYKVKTLIWQAIAHQGLAQEAQALDSLKQALLLAAPEGYVRSFLEAGEDLIPLLRQARAAGISPDYVDKLLAVITQRDKVRTVQTEVASPLIEPLSGRELEVLKLLAQGHPDKQIAETLVIARETVHKHLKNIYGKLDVHSRTEAIARARQLGLL